MSNPVRISRKESAPAHGRRRGINHSPKVSPLGTPSAPPAYRRNKFNAVKTKLDGYTFDSKAEAKRYGDLKLLEKAGKIANLVVHPKFYLHVKETLVATYKADFQYWDVPVTLRSMRVEDVKSPVTAKKRDFVLIRRLMLAVHGIDVEVVV